LFQNLLHPLLSLAWQATYIENNLEQKIVKLEKIQEQKVK
jgi:hypothetical protein